MRVAVFTSKYPAKVATFFERDMRALREAGLDVDIFAINPLEEELWRYSRELLDTGLPRERVHHLGIPASLGRIPGALLRRGGSMLRDAAPVLGAALRFGAIPAAKTAYVIPKAWAWAAEHGDDYDHVFAYWGNYAGTCAYLFHRLLRRPVPFTIWLHAGVDLYRTPVFMREKLRYADNIITCCEFNADYIHKEFGAAVPGLERKLHVVHHGLDLAQFPFRAGGRPANKVIAVGRLAAHKGFDYLVEAAALMQRDGVDAEIAFVGDGEEQRPLQELAARLGVAERVHFRGWMSSSGARDAMAAATVLVHPSDGLGDGLPNVIREAMAVGTPVVASRVAGIPDALEGGCGVLVPPKDAAALAKAIASLLGNAAEREGIAQRARRRVEERYDLWKNGTRLADVLKATERGVTPVAAAA